MKFCWPAEKARSAAVFPATIPYCFEDFCGMHDFADAARRHPAILNYHKFNCDLFSCFTLLSPVSSHTRRARAYYIIKDIMPLFEIIIKGRRRHRRRPGF